MSLLRVKFHPLLKERPPRKCVKLPGQMWKGHWSPRGAPSHPEHPGCPHWVARGAGWEQTLIFPASVTKLPFVWVPPSRPLSRQRAEMGREKRDLVDKGKEPEGYPSTSQRNHRGGWSVHS